MLACLGAAIATSGIQAMAPAIPAIQAEFSLTTAEVGLITSVYLFPSIFSAFGAGVLADRFGVRLVFAVSLLIFGIGGLVLLVQHSFATLMLVRCFQGAAFGALLSLSVAIIGGVVPTGAGAARAQGRRIIAMASAEATFPVAGGLLLAVSWFAPFAIQVLALPLAVLVWVFFPPIRPRRVPRAAESARALVRAPAIVGIQTLGVSHFIFKIGVWTYYPVLAVNLAGLSPALVGLVMGASSLLAALAAWRTDKLFRRWTPTLLIAGCLFAIGLSFAAMGLVGNPVVLVLALLLFGIQDGVFGVAHTVLVTERAPVALRSTYVGLTGTMRNIGKFLAPVLFGSATVVMSLPHTFLLMATVSGLTVSVARRVGRVE